MQIEIYIAFGLIFLCIIGLFYSHTDGWMKRIIMVFIAFVLFSLGTNLTSLIKPVVIEKEKYVYLTDMNEGSAVRFEGKDYCIDSVTDYEFIGKMTLYLKKCK